jgi:putative tricarboxylic transport membrane protein
MKLGRDGIAGLIGLAISLGLMPIAYNLPKLPIVPVGPGFYPLIVLAFMAMTCGLLLLQDVAAQRKSARAPPAETPAQPPRDYRLVAAAFAVVIAYILLLPQLGFRIASALFVAAFQLALDRPKTAMQWLMLAAIAVGTSAVTYLVFDQYLSVLLPRGRWTNW